MNHWLELLILTAGVIVATVFAVRQVMKQLFSDRGACRACSDSCLCEDAAKLEMEEQGAAETLRGS